MTYPDEYRKELANNAVRDYGAEVERLRELVAEAYAEGFYDAAEAYRHGNIEEELDYEIMREHWECSIVESKR